MERFIHKLISLRHEFPKILLILIIFLFTTYQKYKILDNAGGDLTVYREAVTEFLAGRNPYRLTVKSFMEPESGLDHGYAYLPTLLYIFTPLYKLHLAMHIPLQRIWKMPLFFADIGVGLILIKILYKKNFWALLAGLLFWWYNPYVLVKNAYSYTEALGIFSLLLGVYFLEKDDALAGLLYALAFSFKAFPTVVFPLFFLKVKNKLKFLFVAGLFIFVISIPFMRVLNDFETYIQGGLLVHGSREPQGRPILFMVSYYTGLPIFSVALTSFYVYLSIFSSWILQFITIIKKKLQNKYLIAMISFSMFFFLTPVLTRTYLIWLIPFYILGMYKLFEKDLKYYYISLALFYLFYAGYLYIWAKGLSVVNDAIIL